MDVTGKTAIVTGGGRGIGRGIALALARNGADVVVAEIIEENGASASAEVEAVGRRSLAAALDVTDQASVDALMPSVLSEFEHVDILVNNAGIIGAPGWEQRQRTNEEDWDLIYEVNVKGVMRVTDAVAPHMKERRYGKIVNIASIAGRIGTLTSGPYGASKAAVINLTQYWALELAPYAINVNAVCPGLLWTPLWDRIATRYSRDTEKYPGMTPREVFKQTVQERIPLGREQTPEDIGNAVAFLASDAARNITGQALNVSGGSHMN
jgi:meso-butanediol dehydrogenase/(S,S)-butanediol dehydrogenase/diacetyl reductase